MSNEELLELAEKGYITKVGEYEAAASAASAYTVESAAGKKDFVDATSYAEIKAQIDTDYKLTLTASENCKYQKKVGKNWEDVSGELTCDKDSKVIIKAVPTDATAYEFDKWEDDATATAQREIVMNESKTVKALMKAKAPVVTEQ